METTDKTFEQLLGQIDDILQKLEHDDLDLEQSLKLYEDGMTAYRDANAKLAAARGRLAQLVAIDEHGNQTTAPISLGLDE